MKRLSPILALGIVIVILASTQVIPAFSRAKEKASKAKSAQLILKKKKSGARLEEASSYSMSPAPTVGYTDSVKGYQSARHERRPQANGRARIAKQAIAKQATVKQAAAKQATAKQMIVASASASVPSVSTVASTSVAPAVVTPRFGGALLTGVSTNLYKWDSPNSTQDLSAELSGWARVGEQWTADAVVDGTKALSGLRESTVRTAMVGFSNVPWELNPALKYRIRMTYSLPIQNEANRISSSRGSLGALHRLFFAPAAWKGFNSYYQLSMIRHFYQYTTSGAGESNNAWTFTNRVLVNYALNDHFYVEVTPALSTGFTFAGNPLTRFVHSEEFGYNITPQWSVGIGHENSGEFYRENGRDSNFTLTNGQTSSVYLSTGVAF